MYIEYGIDKYFSGEYLRVFVSGGEAGSHGFDYTFHTFILRIKFHWE